MESRTEENTVVSLTVALSGMGCTIIAAPVEHHEILMRVLQPLVDAELVGPVIVLDGANCPSEHEAYLSAAADHLLGVGASAADAA